jgi:nucleotide-binding universal stress UspA family protein
MKKILVPTDFSACAESAFSVALEIARNAGAELIVQHLYDDKYGSKHVLTKSEKPETDPALGPVKAALDELVTRAEHIGVNARPLLVMNKGIDKIENYIEPLGIDLVVMGSHGATGIRELVVGSQTERVVRHASAPVLVIKHKPENIKFEKIVFASTFHEDPAKAVAEVLKLAALWKGVVHLLYVGLEKDKQAKAEIDEKINALEAQFPSATFTRNFITTNDPEWGIKHASKDIAPDAIALTTQVKTGTFIFSHSLAESLVNHETLPVLVINT